MICEPLARFVSTHRRLLEGAGFIEPMRPVYSAAYLTIKAHARDSYLDKQLARNLGELELSVHPLHPPRTIENQLWHEQYNQEIRDHYGVIDSFEDASRKGLI